MYQRSRLLLRFGFMKATPGQRLLPLVLLMASATAASAAVDQEARIQLSRQQSQLSQIQNKLETLDSWRTTSQGRSTLLESRYDGLHEVQQQLNSHFLALREQQNSISGEWSALRDNHRKLATKLPPSLRRWITSRRARSAMNSNLRRSRVRRAGAVWCNC